MISTLAEKLCDNGKKTRGRPTFIVIHNTGSTNLKRCIRYYKSGEAYPHYLIDHEGKIYSFCDELKTAAHAAWKDWELIKYKANTWKEKFFNLKTSRVENCEPTLYADWVSHWAIGKGLKNPRSIALRSGGKTPNQSSIGIELLAPQSYGFTSSQYLSLARLVLDISIRHAIPLAENPDEVFPTVYLCGHDDIGPCRRYAKRRDGTGYGYDPGPKFNWPTLLDEIKNNTDLTKWWEPSNE